ncbi:DUF4225 domain-containing protein [Pseudomonas sp. IT-P100]|uniref:DUF4225 domain-containing protein n=1 Tax=Pseudomonas sp. IT-P100 TaxID=3026452 RepID=UPI002ABA220C|nr:DUF4225 domain-containing protein [Pseudomonas sp.]
MNDDLCDIHDVTKAASNLVAFGCSIGATHLYDSFLQLQFSSIVSSFSNEIIRAVDEGLISARQGMQKIRDEYAGLSSKVIFYTQNGVGILAGAMQIQAGASLIGNSRGIKSAGGLVYIAHGVNNMYESAGNIYNGPDTSGTVGPIRKTYQRLAENTRTGNTIYYSIDLGLSAFGAMSLVRKNDTLELFRRDPINYERAYRQMGRLALAFEALIDTITIKNITEETTLK